MYVVRFFERPTMNTPQSWRSIVLSRPIQRQRELAAQGQEMAFAARLEVNGILYGRMKMRWVRTKSSSRS